MFWIKVVMKLYEGFFFCKLSFIWFSLKGSKSAHGCNSVLLKAKWFLECVRTTMTDGKPAVFLWVTGNCQQPNSDGCYNKAIIPLCYLSRAMIWIWRVEHKEVVLRILYNNDFFFSPSHSACIQQVTGCENTCGNDYVMKVDSNKI